MRFDDLVRSERYFTATLLPAVLFHNNLDGVRSFTDLVEQKATTERNQSGERVKPKGTVNYDFQDVEVITEFHIARDLTFARLPPEDANAEASEEDEPKKDAPDVVIVAGRELVVCEGKFFSDFTVQELNKQLCSQRVQVKLLFGKKLLFENRQKIRAYRHVAIVPFVPTIEIDADVVLTWNDIRNLAETLLGKDHYVTVRLRKAVERYEELLRVPGISSWDGIVTFDEMRKTCRGSESGDRDKVQVGHAGGRSDLLRRNLVYAENKRWKWRNPKTNRGVATSGNWLDGPDWLAIVESQNGFRGRGEGVA
jgi:hypothetical protein